MSIVFVVCDLSPSPNTGSSALHAFERMEDADACAARLSAMAARRYIVTPVSLTRWAVPENWARCLRCGAPVDLTRVRRGDGWSYVGTDAWVCPDPDCRQPPRLGRP